MAADTTEPSTPPSTPSPLNYIISFLIVGICWGFTTPFIRKAAINYKSPEHPAITDPHRWWITRKAVLLGLTVLGLLRSPKYAIPLLLNLTGSIWFFLLVGQAGMSYQIPCCLCPAWVSALLGIVWTAIEVYHWSGRKILGTVGFIPSATFPRTWRVSGRCRAGDNTC